MDEVGRHSDSLSDDQWMRVLAGTAAWEAARRAFPEPYLRDWCDALATTAGPGKSAAVLLEPLQRASVECARILGPQAGVALVSTTPALAGSGGRNAARAVLAHAPRSASHLGSEAAFRSWLALLQELAAAAPDCLASVAGRSDGLLSEFGLSGFSAWLRTGLAETAGDRLRQSAYFSLSDVGALRVLEQEASDVPLALLERRLKGLLAALWRLHPAVRPLAVKAALQAPRRATFDGLLLRLPENFAGFRGAEAERLYKAAVTHIGAHIEYTTVRFEARALKPIQIALVSLLEDARVETLAGEEFPGLLRLWRRFHVADEAGASLAEPLLARLARALIDPDFDDENPWVRKGRSLFLDSRAKWDDPSVIREIGVLLGNDLGQMRLQFNAKTYVVQPPYRDDNLGIWDFGDPPEQTADDVEVIHESVRIEQAESADRPHQRERHDGAGEDASKKAKVVPAEEDAGIPVARYSEWNYVTGRERHDWTTIVEYEAPKASAAIIERELESHAETLRRLMTLIQHAQISRPRRLKRQPEGERFDLEAGIRAVIDRRSGLTPDPRVYESSAFLERDLSVLLLLDISESTKDLIQGAPPSVFSIERASAAVLANAMWALGDPFAIHAFCSNGRDEVRYYRVKDFAQAFEDGCADRLAGLRPGYSTRVGAALRHAGADMARQASFRRLILLITDGEPSDIDVNDDKYLVEDARRAVHDLAHQGVDVFCVGLDVGGDGYLKRIFGQRNMIQIDRVASLPEKLPFLYLRLTA